MAIDPSVLEQFAALEPLGESGRSSMAPLLTSTRYRAGSQICREGDDGDSCYMLSEGTVEVVKNLPDGRRVKRARFYIDPETCTGDHGCIRLSGCPSLTIRENPDPLRSDPVSYVDNSCVGCGVCGTNAHSAVLCPSFSRVEMIHNPTAWDRLLDNTRARVREWWRTRDRKRMAQRQF